MNTSPAFTTISLPSTQNFNAPSRISELLVVMAVQRDDTAFFHQDARHHNVVPYDKLALQQRVQIFQLDRRPGNILQFHLVERLCFALWGLGFGVARA